MGLGLALGRADLGREGVDLFTPNPALLARLGLELGHLCLPRGGGQPVLTRFKGQFVGPILPVQIEGLRAVALVFDRDPGLSPGPDLLGVEPAPELMIGGHSQRPQYLGHLIRGSLAGYPNRHRIAFGLALGGTRRVKGQRHLLLLRWH